MNNDEPIDLQKLWREALAESPEMRLANEEFWRDVFKQLGLNRGESQT